MPARPWSWAPSRRPSSESAIPASANAMSRARHREICSRPTRSSSAPSRASVRSTCIPWWTPTGPTPSGPCTSPSTPPPRWRCLHNDALPLYPERGLPVKAVLTDNGRAFYGTARHAYDLYLDPNGIDHRRTTVRTPKSKGFVKRFNRTILHDFYRIKMREEFHGSVEARQADRNVSSATRSRLHRAGLKWSRLFRQLGTVSLRCIPVTSPAFVFRIDHSHADYAPWECRNLAASRRHPRQRSSARLRRACGRPPSRPSDAALQHRTLSYRVSTPGKDAHRTINQFASHDG